MELRANDEAAHAVGPDSAIAFMKASRWRRDHDQNTNIRQRLYVYKEWLGFCNHGSAELQLSRLEKIKHENTREA